VINTAKAGYLDTLSYFTLLYESGDNGIDESVIKDIRANENVEKIIKVSSASTNISFMGGYSSTPVIFMEKKELEDLFSRMKLKIKEGRMPENKNEILMHWRIAKNKGYEQGDTIGREINEKEQLTGSYVISGVFDGDSQLSFIPVEETSMENYGIWMVMPRQGKVRDMNSFIYSLPYENMNINSLTMMEEQFKRNMSIVYIGSAFIESLIILVLCITIGNTTYLHFYQRKREFGILMAVGYRRKDILKKILAELSNMIGIAFFLGIFLAIMIGFILKIVYMDPNGSVMNLFRIKYVLVTSVLPVFVLICSLLPSLKIIMNTDKISIIE